jgi:hypothetical protein
MLNCRCLTHFSHNATQLPLKTGHLSTNLKFSLYHFNWTHSLLSCFLGIICFWEGISYFHKIKNRETLSRSHNNLNTTMLTWNSPRASFHQLNCVLHVQEFKIFVFEISSDFFKPFWLCLVKPYVKNSQIRWIYCITKRLLRALPALKWYDSVKCRNKHNVKV